MKKLLLLFRRFILNKTEYEFVKHNNGLWQKWKGDRSKGEILVEENTVASSIVAISYIANFLAQKYNSRITVYSKKSFVLLPRSIRKIYASFNSKFIFYSDKLVRKQATILAMEIYPKLKTKRDIEELVVGGVHIGDLIYDTYLRQYLLPTINIEDDKFKNTLIDGLCLYLYWQNYFNQRNVTSVIVSHCVYSWNAIILRVAVQHSVPVYQATAQRLYYITDSHNYRAYNDFIDYPEKFDRLTSSQKRGAHVEAKKRLELRFSGKVGVDMHYSSKSAYAVPEKSSDKVLKPNNKVKILIAAHCFFDSPHPYGINLFPDFYEWLSFLGNISGKTDYDWYIKTHPDFLPGNLDVINEFIGKYPKFNHIPADTSHNQLIAEGINVALTVYGTIGFEYAARGITVINASMCNPHQSYNFNIHPKTVDEYERLLLDLKNNKHSIDINKVYEYYYCRFIDSCDNWLYDDYKNFIRSIGGHAKQVSDASYQYFLDSFTQDKHDRILTTLESFIESKSYCINQSHLNKADL